jgi:DNA-binding NtrC family response regulator
MTQTMIACSESMRKVAASIARYAATDASIFLWGETGVGREFTGQRIYEASRRAEGPWIHVNWAATPAFLHHALLFGGPGHGPGALERAAGGTLFLDEVPDLDPEAQAELLRVLRAGRFSPGGSGREMMVDVRLISTCCDPQDALERGELRPDLYARLSEVPLELPPLRWRREDIRALAEHFLRETGSWEDFAGKPAPRLTDEAVQVLMDHPWPGNLRQMEVTMIMIAYHAAGRDEITPADIPYVG